MYMHMYMYWLTCIPSCVGTIFYKILCLRFQFPVTHLIIFLLLFIQILCENVFVTFEFYKTDERKL